MPASDSEQKQPWIRIIAAISVALRPSSYPQVHTSLSPQFSNSWWEDTSLKHVAHASAVRVLCRPMLRVCHGVTCFACFGIKITMFFQPRFHRLEVNSHVPSVENMSDDSQRLARQPFDHLWCHGRILLPCLDSSKLSLAVDLPCQIAGSS